MDENSRINVTLVGVCMAGKQQKITLSDEEWAIVDCVAQMLGASNSDIVQLGFRLGIPGLKEIYESGQSFKPSSLKQVLERMDRGEVVTDPGVIEAAHDSGLSVNLLKSLRDCVKTCGEKENVHQHSK